MAEKHFVCERLFDVLLDHARHRPRTHQFIVSIGNPATGSPSSESSDCDVAAIAELSLKPQHELLDHLGDNLLREMREGDGRTSSRLRNSGAGTSC